MQAKPKILIVDDEEGMRKTLCEILQTKGYDVNAASNGKKAIQLSGETFYNVAVLDMKLPDIPGIEILHDIKKGSPNTEVVVITAYASLQTSIEALNEGAFAYLIKPFEFDSLFNTIVSALERQQLIIENQRLRLFNENIVKSLNEGVILEDANRVITFVNPKAIEMLGYQEKEIIGRPLKNFIAPEMEKKEKQVALKNKEDRYEATLLKKKLEPFYVLISSTKLYDKGEFKGVLSVLTDISKTKALESELKERLEELEHFNRLMVGRELRMVELKNRIKELENRIKHA